MTVHVSFQYRNGDWDRKSGEAAFRGAGYLVVFTENAHYMYELEVVNEVKFTAAEKVSAEEAFEEYAETEKGDIEAALDGDATAAFEHAASKETGVLMR